MERTPARSATAMTWSQMGGVVGGLALLVLAHVVPPPEPITAVGLGRVGVLGFAILWWVFAPVSLAVTTLAALALGVLTGVLSLTEAFAASSAWVGWFLVGAFGLSAALEVNGFNRRFALWFVNLPWLRGRPYALLFSFLVSAALMSGLMSNTVVVVVWLSLSMTIYSALRLGPGDTFAETNTLGLAWMANIGGVMTPVGTPTNAVAIGLVAAATGVTIGFAAWSIIGLFAVACLVLSTCLVVRYLLRPDVSAIAGPEAAAYLKAEQESLGPQSPAERWSLIWFGVAIVLWLLPDALRLFMSAEAVPRLIKNLGLSVPAILAPCAMCVTPVEQEGRSRVLTWKEWSAGVDWGMVLFIVGVLALGAAVGADGTGVPEFLGRHVEPAVSALPELLFVFVLVCAVMTVTNMMSNLVTVAVFLPLSLTLSLALHVGYPPAVGIVLGMAPSLSYALPSGTTTNAIVAGTGWLRIGAMARQGFALMLVHAVILALLVYPFAKLVLGG